MASRWRFDRRGGIRHSQAIGGVRGCPELKLVSSVAAEQRREPLAASPAAHGKELDFRPFSVPAQPLLLLLFQGSVDKTGRELPLVVHLQKPEIIGFALKTPEVHFPLPQRSREGFAFHKIMPPGLAKQEVVTLVGRTRQDKVMLARLFNKPCPVDRLGRRPEEVATGTRCPPRGRCPIGRIHLTSLPVQHLPCVRRRTLQIGNDDGVPHSLEASVALPFPVERPGRRLPNGQHPRVEPADIEDIVPASLELECVDADLVFPRCRQADGEAAVASLVIHAEQHLVLLRSLDGQLQDRIEFGRGHVGDDRLVFLALKEPAVELVGREVLRVTARPFQLPYRLLGGRCGGARANREEHGESFLHSSSCLLGD